jgi:hypothetical protein
VCTHILRGSSLAWNQGNVANAYPAFACRWNPQWFIRFFAINFIFRLIVPSPHRRNGNGYQLNLLVPDRKVIVQNAYPPPCQSGSLVIAATSIGVEPMERG